MGKVRGPYYLRRKVNMDGYFVSYIDEAVKLRVSSDFWDRW